MQVNPASHNPSAHPAAPQSAPPSVIVAAAALGFLLLIRLVTILLAVVRGGGTLYSVWNVGIGGLILGGLVKGNRLAWQWGRLVSGLAVVYLVATAVTFDGKITPAAMIVAGVVVAAMIGALIVMLVALSTSSAKRHFRLVCPQCGKVTSLAADFAFDRAKCRTCKITW